MTLLMQITEGGLTMAAVIMMFTVFMISVLITRWIFGIPTILKHLKMQTANMEAQRRVINLLAKQQGVPEEEIAKIIETVNAEIVD